MFASAAGLLMVTVGASSSAVAVDGALCVPFVPELLARSVVLKKYWSTSVLPSETLVARSTEVLQYELELPLLTPGATPRVLLSKQLSFACWYVPTPERR